MSTVVELLKQARQNKGTLHLEHMVWGLLEDYHAYLEEFDYGWVQLVKLGWMNYVDELCNILQETLSENASYAPNRIISIDDEQASLDILDILDSLPEEFE